MGDKLNILVVGNGFDIAHGLPTRYTDFLEFLKLLKYQNDKKSQKWLLEKSKFPKELLQFLENAGGTQRKAYWNELLSQMESNTWIEYFLKVKIPDYGWVGFEGEITHIVKTLDRMRVNASDMAALQHLKAMTNILDDAVIFQLMENGSGLYWTLAKFMGCFLLITQTLFIGCMQNPLG